MINIKKISDEKYIAVVDLITFESYGLSVNNVQEEESFSNIDNLINDITSKIYTEYKDILGDFCDVGILVEHEGVVISLVKSSEEDFYDDDDDFETDVFDGIEEHLISTVMEKKEYDLLENNLNLVNMESVVDNIPADEDYSEGLVTEFRDIESFIKLLAPLSKVLSKEEKISLYYNNFDNVYYLLLNKTEKLARLFTDYTIDIEEDDIRLEVEYELAEDIYMEYSKIKSFFIERGFKSTKTFSYLEEFCDVIYDSGSVKKLARIFK